VGVERRVGRVLELGGEESTDRDHYAFIRTDPFTYPIPSFIKQHPPSIIVNALTGRTTPRAD
jgi:hypothetical protein